MDQKLNLGLVKEKMGLIIGIIFFASLFGWGFWSMVQLQEPAEVIVSKLPTEPKPVVVAEKNNEAKQSSLLDLRLERNRIRSKELEELQQLVLQTELSAETRKQAESEILQLTQRTSREQELENLLKAKGFGEAVVTVGQQIITIVLRQKLDGQKAALIGDLAVQMTGFSPEKIQIVEHN